MSKEFIERRLNNKSLEVARRQYKQLSYFITSKIQEDVDEKYFKEYIDRKYYNDDVFLNFIKSIFNSSNFLTFSKYYREPNPASSLINTRIKEPLSRVFFAEDSYFNYIVNGEEDKFPDVLQDDFNENLFDAVLERYNDIIVHDLYDTNKPFREFICIDKVVSIKMNRNEIEKVAYSARIEVDDEYVYGYAYIDDEKYQFFNSDKELLKTEFHDLGKCPATFVVNKRFSDDDIVKESLFSYVRPQLEEYSFLVTLQRMANASGTMPVAVIVDTKIEGEDNLDFDNTGSEPMSAQQINGQVNNEAKGTAGSGLGSELQAGTVIKAPPTEDKDGVLNFELAKNYINFHYTPVEALKNLASRIASLENSIMLSLLGDLSEGNQASMTEFESVKGYITKEDKLRWLSNTLSKSRKLSDYVMLSLAHGKDNIKADIFYGSDFLQENQEKLYKLFKDAPNVIEKRNILIRLAQRRNMFNKEKSKREVIIYKILPYSDNEDFKLAVDNQMVDDVTFTFQTKFSYWISLFESAYGSVVDFWNNSESKESEKIIEITNLIKELIITNTNFKTKEDGKESN